MDAFDQAVQEAQEKRAAPVAEAKKALAATRAAATQVLREFNDLARTLRPRLQDAQVKFQRAAAMGVRPLQLQMYLGEVFGDGGIAPGILEGTPTGLRDLINRIDGLTEWHVYQGIPARLPGLLPSLRAGRDSLEKLAAAIEDEVAALAEHIRRANGVPVLMAVEPPPEPTTIAVVTDFEP